MNSSDPSSTPHSTHRSVFFWATAAAILPLAIAISFFLVAKRSPTHLSVRFSPVTAIFTRPTVTAARPPCVLWMAPFLSGGGYGSEAWAYIIALRNLTETRGFRIKIAHHGDLQDLDFWDGLSPKHKELAYELHNTVCDMKDTVVVCHSEPGAWWPPLFRTDPCPPSGYEEPRFVIGRTMFETDRLNVEHARRCNRMDAVWVPTDFHVSTFANSGVVLSKLVKVIQPVDVDFFDPSRYRRLRLPCEDPVLGSSTCGEAFAFLSVFKWEKRKGWDLLLQAYLEEFSGNDDIALYLLTRAYHSDADFGKKIKQFAEQSVVQRSHHGWPRVYVMENHIPQSDLPKLYRAVDAFVLPTRGEGWGRPVVEAMAMSLPVIATNWSGLTEYLTEENGYPLPVNRMVEVEDGPFKGHLWAEPSVEELRVLMRKLVSEPEKARKRGRRAREHMVRRFSPDVVGGVVAGEISKVLEMQA